MEIFATVDLPHLFLIAGNHTHISSLMILQRDVGGSFFYQADQAPPKRKFGLRSFTDGPTEEHDRWGVMDDFTMDDEC
jgi:hypothetical protein